MDLGTSHHGTASPMNAIPILMYHNIAPVPRGVRLSSLYVTPPTFSRQMWVLRRLGYRGVSMAAAMPYLRGEQHGRIAVITLDDGYADNLTAALPVLQKHGFSATCYMVSKCVGQHNRWDAERLGITKNLMSLEQLKTWHGSGMEVGAHTRTHPHLTRCDDAQLRDEIIGCKAELENILGAPVTQFCYPYGDLNDHVVEVVRQAGFSAATTTQRRRAQPGEDLLHLPRVHIARRNLLPIFALKILTNHEQGRL